MKIPDVNLLVYAFDERSQFHHQAKRWLSDLLSGSERIGFSWIVLLGFIRISTSRRILDQPMSPAEAFSIVEGWLLRQGVHVIHPTNDHFEIVRGLLEPLGIGGDITTDAHLAALAIEHGGEVCSADNDFARFPTVRWSNPLA
ncbi:MAG: type II toxin-antitoxin system VapC family toxin [Thermomicrobiales bacterium]|nr:type II toxin-antitoxin system VapC family toxin [Thermomicrobiales bacterium]